MLGLYRLGELTCDRHNTLHERIFRLVNEYKVNGLIDSSALMRTQQAGKRKFRLRESPVLAHFMMTEAVAAEQVRPYTRGKFQVRITA